MLANSTAPTLATSAIDPDTRPRFDVAAVVAKTPKPNRGGRPKSGRVVICANVLPATAATLRAKAKALAKATGNRRPQLGAAIEHFVSGPSITLPCGCLNECTCGSRAHL
jgi:hypothetical protein